MRAERDAALAENSDLRSQCAVWNRSAGALQVENAALRAALEEYDKVGQSLVRHFGDVRKHFTELNALACASKAAHAALKRG